MSETTTLEKLARILPESETHWRTIAARAHRLRHFPGDEAMARSHETIVSEIRRATNAGSSRSLRFCPRCLAHGPRYPLISIGGSDCCGTCLWPGTREDFEIPGL